MPCLGNGKHGKSTKQAQISVGSRRRYITSRVMLPLQVKAFAVLSESGLSVPGEILRPGGAVHEQGAKRQCLVRLEVIAE